jgi:hypothetical protein
VNIVFVFNNTENDKEFVFPELGHPGLNTWCLADPDLDSAADIPADEMLRQKTPASEEHHSFEGNEKKLSLSVYKWPYSWCTDLPYIAHIGQRAITHGPSVHFPPLL